MPLFEYRCNECGSVTVFLEKIGQNETEHKCKECDSTDTQKIFSKVSQKKEVKSTCSTGTCPF